MLELISGTLTYITICLIFTGLCVALFVGFIDKNS